MQKSTPNWLYSQLYDEFKASKRYREGNAANVRNIAEPGRASILVSSNYSPLNKPKHKHTLKMTFQGTFVRAQVKYGTDRKFTRAKRSYISSFSRQSRSRLMDLFHKIEVKRLAIFVTLTYPEDYPNAQTAKAHLRAFFKRLERYHDKADLSAIWRLEPQQRGAPHFHIVFFGLPYTPKEKIQQMWDEIVGGVRLFTRIEAIYSNKKLMNYVSKYVAKVEQSDVVQPRFPEPTEEELLRADEPAPDSGFNTLTYLSAYVFKYGENIGRVWGYLNKKDLPFAPLEEIELQYVPVQFEPFRRWAVSIFPRIGGYLSAGFKLYIPSAEAALRAFHVLHDINFQLDTGQLRAI